MKTYLLLTVAALAFVTAVMSIIKYIRYTRSAFRELRVLSRHTHRRHRKAPYFRIDGAFAEEPDNVLESEEKYSLFLRNAPEPGDVIVVRYLEGKRFLISPSHLLIQALIRAALGAALVLIAFRG
ncbi:MAG: hypothetical protein II714_05380 [Oscillospiraceae bacterium]|nr:hypothetical protein [Oscillospiraceae bacterium]